MKLRILMLLLLSSAAHAGCQDQNYDPNDNYVLGAPGPVQLFHVQGQNQCNSKQNWGYWCAVSVRDATDCGSGHMRNRNTNCCHYFNGVKQENPVVVGYNAGACSPFY
jgi:hypothetical protein